MIGIIKCVCSMKIVIVARSLLSLVTIWSYLKADPMPSQIGKNPSPYRRPNAREIVFRLGYSFRASAASAQRVTVCRQPMVWHIGTLKYSLQPKEPIASIELFTDIRLQVINIFTQLVIVRRKTVVCNNQNH